MDPSLLKGFWCSSSGQVMFQSFGFGRWRIVWFWEQLEVKIVSAHASAAWLVVLVCCLWKATQDLVRKRIAPVWAGSAVTITVFMSQESGSSLVRWFWLSVSLKSLQSSQGLIGDNHFQVRSSGCRQAAWLASDHGSSLHPEQVIWMKESEREGEMEGKRILRVETTVFL